MIQLPSSLSPYCGRQRSASAKIIYLQVLIRDSPAQNPLQTFRLLPRIMRCSERRVSCSASFSRRIVDGVIMEFDIALSKARSCITSFHNAVRDSDSGWSSSHFRKGKSQTHHNFRRYAPGCRNRESQHIPPATAIVK